MSIVDRLLMAVMLGVAVLAGGSWLLAWWLRDAGLRWTWALAGLPLSLLVLSRVSGVLGPLGFFASALAGARGAKWHRRDLQAGADLAEVAQARVGIGDVLRDALDRRWPNLGIGIGEGGRGRVDPSRARGAWLEVGRDRRGRAACIPTGSRPGSGSGPHSGSHTLIVGATGSGKTVSDAWIACRLIEAGHGAVAIDPKGDGLLAEQLRASAARRGVPFLEWSPGGSLAYNPYAHG